MMNQEEIKIWVEEEKIFELNKAWCENHGFPYKIINNHFYWQTRIQTGENYKDENGKWRICWHSKNFFEEI